MGYKFAIWTNIAPIAVNLVACLWHHNTWWAVLHLALVIANTEVIYRVWSANQNYNTG